ncbi:hypothetical protein Pcinc_010071 [Petrolisthes cinctipes]|uniref:Uncharacterized protein n=1 Tax=Petrolisthes cinctipes TaxID=88211 RepID=A0AAE1G3H2_PETCI|nr:hypothetical protein Pcinc_010071 [Petrolisthes cinctipes]
MLLHHYEADPAILEWLWFSYEALFHLYGCVNQHNARFLGTGNPVNIREHQKNSPKLVVWCAMSSLGFIRSCFFKKENEDATTVTGVNYHHMLQNIFVPSWHKCMAFKDEAIFQQD